MKHRSSVGFRISAWVAVACAALAWPTADVASRDDAPPLPQTHAVAVRGARALVARDRGVDLVDLSPATDPGEDDAPYAVLGSIGLATSVYDALWWSDDLAWIAGGSDGVTLLDLSTPDRPAALHRIETRGSSRRLARSGDVLYVADELGGLLVVDAARPERARIRRTISSRNQVRSVVVDGDRLATAEGGAGARVFDIERPDAPRETDRIDTRASVSVVALAGACLVVGSGPNGFEVRVDDGRGEWTVSTKTVDVGRVEDLVVEDGRLFATSAASGLQIYDIDVRRGSVHWIGGVRLPRSFPAGRVAPAPADRLLIAAGVAGVADVDLTDPTAPRVTHPRESSFRIRWAD